MIRISNSLEILLNKTDENDNAVVRMTNNQSVFGSIRNLELKDLFTLKISKYAFDKMIFVAREAFKIKKSAVESYWLLKGESFVEDILVPEQSVSHAYVSVSPAAIRKISKIVQDQRLKIMGWGHSHADFGVFFSGTDRGNQMTVFHDTTNYIRTFDGDLIKYSYGSTFNIHKNVFAMLSYQQIGKDIKSVEIGYEIIDDGRVFNPESENLDLENLLIH